MLAEDASTAPVQRSPAEWTALLPKLEQAAKADPKDASAQRRLAMAYFSLGRLNAAAAIYKKLLNAEEDAVVRNRLGNVYRAQGAFAEAEASYKQAMKTDPALPAPYLNLAELYYRQHDDQQALTVIKTGLAKVPEASRQLLEQAAKVIESGGRTGDATTTAAGGD
jgi:cellulose synthase operon protein C